jgi:hypothetical protein
MRMSSGGGMRMSGGYRSSGGNMARSAPSMRSAPRMSTPSRMTSPQYSQRGNVGRNTRALSSSPRTTAGRTDYNRLGGTTRGSASLNSGNSRSGRSSASAMAGANARANAGNYSARSAANLRNSFKNSGSSSLRNSLGSATARGNQQFSSRSVGPSRGDIDRQLGFTNRGSNLTARSGSAAMRSNHGLSQSPRWNNSVRNTNVSNVQRNLARTMNPSRGLNSGSNRPLSHSSYLQNNPQRQQQWQRQANNYRNHWTGNRNNYFNNRFWATHSIGFPNRYFNYFGFGGRGGYGGYGGYGRGYGRGYGGRVVVAPRVAPAPVYPYPVYPSYGYGGYGGYAPYGSGFGLQTGNFSMYLGR